MGSIVAVIVLELVRVAAEMAGWIAPEDAGDNWTMDKKSATVALLTLLITIISWVTLRGFLKIIPILIGIISAYIIAAFAGLVDFHALIDSSWVALPFSYHMKFDLSA